MLFNVNMLDNRYYTDQEVAQLFQKHIATIRRWAKKGKYGAIKRGQKWYFEKSKIL